MAGIMCVFQVACVYYGLLIASRPVVAWNVVAIVINAARTDPELADVLIPAIHAFDRAWFEASREVFPDLAQSKAFMIGNAVTLYLLEGLAANLHTRRAGPLVDEILAWLKGELHQAFSDVHGLDRESAQRIASTRAKRRPKT